MQSQILHVQWGASGGPERQGLERASLAGHREISRSRVDYWGLSDKGLCSLNRLQLASKTRGLDHRSLSRKRNPSHRNMAGQTVPHVQREGTAERATNGASFKSKIQDGDAILIVDHGSRRPQSNALLNEFVKMYKEETGHRVVEAAHMELATPTIADAFDRCVEQGATRVIISPYFLSPGRHWDKDIPALVAEAARKHVGVAYLVAAPIGLHQLMVTIIRDRMEYCVSQAAGDVSECDMCKGSGRCKEVANEGSQTKPLASISTT